MTSDAVLSEMSQTIENKKKQVEEITRKRELALQKKARDDLNKVTRVVAKQEKKSLRRIKK